MEKIGRGTWLDTIAFRLIEREQGLGRSTSLLRVESGLGASGIPHVGSLGDAVRAWGVKLALEDAGHRSELIAYSDDMDGLRKVPEGLPEWLNEHIAEPVSYIKDPFSCHGSYAEHMSFLLRDALDRVGVEYRFQSGREAYEKGWLTDQIGKILEDYQRIGKRIAEMLGQKKFEKVLPYYPVCDRCGRMYLAEAHQYLADERRVLYKCVGSEVGRRWVEGCGYDGEADIGRAKGKLSWKGEFAARWAAFDIRFEAYGKDIADSVRVNDWISDEVLGFPHPYHAKYEMFLDKSGKKISKSLGNVFTPQAWLKYGSPQSLLLLMFKRIAGTRSLSIDDIPNYMDEYDLLEDVYLGRREEKNPAQLRKMRGLYEYVNFLKPSGEPSPHIPYSLLVQLASVAPKEGKADFVIKRLKSYGMLKDASGEVKEKVMLAVNWADDYSTVRRTVIALDEKQRGAVLELLSFIRDEADPSKVQGEIFDIARRHGIEPRDFFTVLYRILIGTDRGPRLGPYMVDLGVDRVSKHLSGAVG